MTKNFRFSQTVEVASAFDPAKTVTIRAGIWPVTYDGMISRHGNGQEYEITDTGEQTVLRILVQTLDELVDRGIATIVD